MNLETIVSSQSTSGARIYQNVMESLVEKEIESQLKQLPQNLSRYLDPIDVATYALNRLPPLYAATEKGKTYQELVGQSKLKTQIVAAVRQAIIAVQRDPIRKLTPLTSKNQKDYHRSKKALAELQDWLITHHLLGLEPVTWENLLNVFRNALRAVLKPHLIAMENLQNLLINNYHLSLSEDITYENLVEVVDTALLQVGEGKTGDYSSSRSSVVVER
jgi:Late competence development protein ComFB